MFSYSAIGMKDDSLNIDKKHHFYFYWGYNRSAYLKSDITMHGKGYHYTLHKVTAQDRFSAFDPKIYFNPLTISIPQFNFRGGYQINKKWWVSLGYDHMKYVVNTNQKAKISGNIDSTASEKYAGIYNNDDIVVTYDFLAFEHTDGLNFISADLDYVSSIWKSKSEKFNLEHHSGISLGVLYPRTDVYIFGNQGPNIWNLAGYGIALKSQFRLNMWKHLFIQTNLKSGFIGMPKIKTTGIEGEWAKQNIFFGELFCVIGFKIGLGS